MYFDIMDFIFSNNCLFLVETYTNKLQMLTSPCFTRYVVNTAPKVATKSLGPVTVGQYWWSGWTGWRGWRPMLCSTPLYRSSGGSLDWWTWMRGVPCTPRRGSLCWWPSSMSSNRLWRTFEFWSWCPLTPGPEENPTRGLGSVPTFGASAIEDDDLLFRLVEFWLEIKKLVPVASLIAAQVDQLIPVKWSLHMV